MAPLAAQGTTATTGLVRSAVLSTLTTWPSVVTTLTLPTATSGTSEGQCAASLSTKYPLYYGRGLQFRIGCVRLQNGLASEF